jgi:hypothetical protein
MRPLTQTISFCVIAILTFTNSARAQQIASIAGGLDNPPEEMSHRSNPTDDHKAQISTLKKRIDALTSYLSTVSPSSRDYQVTEQAIRTLNLKLKGLTAYGGDDSSQKIGGQGSLKEFCLSHYAETNDKGDLVLKIEGQPSGKDTFNLNLRLVETDYKVARALIEATFLNQCNGVPSTSGGGGYQPETSKKTVQPAPQSAELDDPNFYCIIHIVDWTEETPGKPTVADNKWYLYRGGLGKKGFKYINQSADAWKIDSDRIYGSKRVALLYVHLHAHADWNIEYDVTVKGKQSEALVNLGALLSSGLKTAGNEPRIKNALWNGKMLDISHQPADIDVVAKFKVAAPGAGTSGNAPADAKKDNAKADAEEQTADYEKKYDDEGLSYWNVSAGIPLKNVSTLQFNVADNTLTASKVDKQKFYGFLDIYLPAADIKGGHWQRLPHLILGLPLSGKPLNDPAVALSYGYSRAQGYAGFSFDKVSEPTSLQVGAPATQPQLNANLRSRYKSHVIFGINIPFGQLIKKAAQ